MRLYPETRVKVERDRFEGEWSVYVANEPYNSWLNVPVTFRSEEAALRVADSILLAERTAR
jgi:hypothetical protein